MFMSIVLGCMYFILFFVLLLRSRFIKSTQLKTHTLLAIYSIKIIAGCVYGYFHLHSDAGLNTDTWKFHTQSLNETKLLLNHPYQFLASIFGNGYQDGGTGFFNTTNSYWNDLKHNLMIGFMSVCNVFTKGNYYLNIIIFNFVTFWGFIAFYKFMISANLVNRVLLLMLMFLLPSFVFWSSGFHKEGILFSLIGWLLLAVRRCTQHRIRIKYILAIIFCLLVITFLRSYLMLFLLPFLSVFVFIEKKQIKNPIYLYLGTAVLFCSIFSSLQYFLNISLIQYTANAHNDFLNLSANTKISERLLTGTASDFIAYLPNALRIGFVEPLLSANSVVLFPSLFDQFLLAVLIVLLVVNFKKTKANNLSLFFLFFTGIIFLFLGYSVPVLGALARYKSFLVPFSMVGFIGMLPFPVSKYFSSIEQKLFHAG